MVDRVDSADKADGSKGAADDEDGLELEGGDIADEGDVGVGLAGVARAAEVEPAQEEDGEGAEPRDGGDDGEVVQAPARVRVEGVYRVADHCVRCGIGANGDCIAAAIDIQVVRGNYVLPGI